MAFFNKNFSNLNFKNQGLDTWVSDRLRNMRRKTSLFKRSYWDQKNALDGGEPEPSNFPFLRFPKRYWDIEECEECQLLANWDQVNNGLTPIRTLSFTENPDLVAYPPVCEIVFNQYDIEGNLTKTQTGDDTTGANFDAVYTVHETEADIQISKYAQKVTMDIKDVYGCVQSITRLFASTTIGTTGDWSLDTVAPFGPYTTDAIDQDVDCFIAMSFQWNTTKSKLLLGFNYEFRGELDCIKYDIRVNQEGVTPAGELGVLRDRWGYFLYDDVVSGDEVEVNATLYTTECPEGVTLTQTITLP